MVAIVVNTPRGRVPRVSANKLGEQYAQTAQNCRLTAGRLDPLREPVAVHTPHQSDIKTLYQYQQLGISAFLTWLTLVDVARSPTSNDMRGRIFWTGDGEPRMTTKDVGISGFAGVRLPHAWFVLGVVAPKTKPTVVVTGGAAPAEDRAYATRFVTTFDEESGFSPVTVASGAPDGTWTISGFDATPANSGTVTSVASASGIATLILDTSYGLAPGEIVTIAGTTGLDGLNGDHKILTATDGVTKRITIALEDAGVGTAGTWERQAPHNLSGMKRRIYRTVGTSQTWFRVAEIDVTDASFDDEVPAGDLDIAVDADDVSPPPKDLHSLIALPNGCLAGLSGNSICFSSPFRPHAWPLAYRYNFPSMGVALAAVGNSVIILTDSFPLISTATTPTNAQPIQLNTYAPCVSKAGAVNIGGGVLYPSHDGLYLATPSSAQNFTNNLFRREEWKRLIPDSFVAAFQSGRYMARHDNIATDPSILALDVPEPDSVIDYQFSPDALYASPWDGELYIVQGDSVLVWDASEARSTVLLWRSKIFTYGDAPVNFAVAQIRAHFAKATLIDNSAWNGEVFASGDFDCAINASPINVLPINGSNLRITPPPVDDAVAFSLLDDKGEIVWSRLVRNGDPFRMPSGFLMEACALQVSARFDIESIAMAESMDELAKVPT